jgi:hypothetical protein
MASLLDRSALRELVAHRQISDAIKRAARGSDRLDKEIFLSAFHPGAIDHHGYHTGTCEEHAEMMEKRHMSEVISSLHLLGNYYIEVDGESANCETYFLAIQRMRRSGGVEELMAGGRYLDRCALRDDEWRIVERHVLIDWTNKEDDPNASMLRKGLRTREDLSYRMLRSGLTPVG